MGGAEHAELKAEVAAERRALQHTEIAVDAERQTLLQSLETAHAEVREARCEQQEAKAEALESQAMARHTSSEWNSAVDGLLANQADAFDELGDTEQRLQEEITSSEATAANVAALKAKVGKIVDEMRL